MTIHENMYAYYIIQNDEVIFTNILYYIYVYIERARERHKYTFMHSTTVKF